MIQSGHGSKLLRWLETVQSAVVSSGVVYFEVEGNMANHKHVEILLNGIASWNEWRSANSDVVPDLSNAQLQDIDLGGSSFLYVNLSKCLLQGADLTNANLVGADLQFSDLTGARLWGCHLYQADLSDSLLVRSSLAYSTLTWTNLSRANLRESILVGTVFAGSVMKETIVTKCIFQRTILADVDISSVVGLESVVHSGPSSISLDTIAKSNGQIPREFLRDSGLSEPFVNVLPSLLTNPAKTTECVIRFVRGDSLFARRLEADLEKRNIKVWRDIQSNRLSEYQLWPMDSNNGVPSIIVLSKNSLESPYFATKLRNIRNNIAHNRFSEPFPIFISLQNASLSSEEYFTLTKQYSVTTIEVEGSRLSESQLDHVARSITVRNEKTHVPKLAGIIGDFSKRSANVLNSIRKILYTNGYESVVVNLGSMQDQLELASLFLSQPKFIVLELSRLVEESREVSRLVSANVITVQPIVSKFWRKQVAEDPDAARLYSYPWVLPVVEYEDVADLINLLRNRMIQEIAIKVDAIEAIRIAGSEDNA